MQVRKNP